MSAAAVLIPIALLLPLALALWLAMAAGAWRRSGRWLLPAASLPAVALALLPAETIRVDWLLLGLDLGTDAASRPFLLLLGIAWSLAAWHALDYVHDHGRRFWLFWLLTLTGISAVFLAQDAAGFYSGYVVMTLAGYGLVLHDRTEEARRAGRVYLVLGLIGEVLIVSGLFALAARFGNVTLVELAAELRSNGPGGWAAGLLFAGFAVKMGTLPLHVWLPLAHPVAPVPASAILSGVIVKAGLFGWIRFLPPEALPTAAPMEVLVVLGLAGAFYAALMGLTQSRPKAILAWSTVSQMGLLLGIFAATLAGPLERDLLLPVLALWALHHGLTKAALFLATGCAPTTTLWRRVLFIVPALSLAGAPLTTGALAKSAAKGGFAAAQLPDWVIAAYTLSSVTTALLLVHLYQRLRATDAQERSAHPAWVLLTIAALAVPWLWAGSEGFAYLPGSVAVWDASWPLLLAAALWWAWRQAHLPVLRLPEDEMLSLWRWARGRAPATFDHSASRLRLPLPQAGKTFAAALERAERSLTRMPAAGAGVILLTLLMWLGLVL